MWISGKTFQVNILYYEIHPLALTSLHFKKNSEEVPRPFRKKKGRSERLWGWARKYYNRRKHEFGTTCGLLAARRSP